MMKRTLLPFFIVLSALFLALSGCEYDDKTGSLNDNITAGKPQPSIQSVAPTGLAYAGLDTIVLQGENFSTVATENTVYFNTSSATLLTASSTKLTLQAPLVVGDNISIKVGVHGADKFSNTVSYKLQAAMVQFGGLLQLDAATALTTDAAGNLYAAITSSGADDGIHKITPDGVRSRYASKTSGVAQWSALKLGPSGVLYAARNIRAIYQFAAGGGTVAALWVAFPAGVSITDFDFDESKNLWAGGNNSNIYRIEPNKTVTPYPFVGNVHSLRVYNGYLYFAARTIEGEKIWRAQISSSGLGTPEVYFDFGAAYPNASAFTITFSSDGILYIGTDAYGRIVVVQPSKAHGTPYATYTTLLSPACNAFAWGNGENLYTSTLSGTLVKITVRGKQSAPYYGAN